MALISDWCLICQKFSNFSLPADKKNSASGDLFMLKWHFGHPDSGIFLRELILGAATYLFLTRSLAWTHLVSPFRPLIWAVEDKLPVWWMVVFYMLEVELRPCRILYLRSGWHFCYRWDSAACLRLYERERKKGGMFPGTLFIALYPCGAEQSVLGWMDS